MYKKQCNNITVSYSVDVKTRPTASIIGMESVIDPELVQLIMDARYSRLPAANKHNFHSAVFRHNLKDQEKVKKLKIK